MKLNSKLAWGAAWTGLALVVAVPSADFLTGNQATPAALITSDTDPVKAVDPTKTASIPAGAPTPGLAPTPRQITLAPVSTPAGTETATSPAPKVTVASPATAESADVQTASLGISATNPPFPAPLAQRPVVTVGPAPVVKAPRTVARIEQPVRTPLVETSLDEPLIIDEDALADEASVVDLNRPTPPAGIADDPADRQSLDEYLARRGLLDDGDSSAIVTYSDASDDYDPDGFYLSDGPGRGSMTSAEWRRWLLSRGVNPDDLEPF